MPAIISDPSTWNGDIVPEIISLKTIQEKMEKEINDSDGTMHLLSEINLSEEEIEFLREADWDFFMQQFICGLSPYPLPTCYYLMDTGRREYDEGRFWINIEPDANRQGKIGTEFLNTMEWYGLDMIKGGRRKYVMNIMFHAFIPEKYAPQFYDFVYRFFKIVLKSQSDDIESHLEIIANVFKDDQFAEKYPELRNMNLIRSTKEALSDKEVFGPILTKIVKRLSNDYESLEDVKLGVFEESFKQWLQNLRSDKKRRKELSVNDPPYLQYPIIQGGSALNLVIPPRIIKNKGDRLRIRDSNGEDMGPLLSLSTSRQFDCLITEEKIIVINRPLECFTVTLGDEIIYDNRNSGHLLLNKNGRRRNKVSIGFNMAVVPKGAVTPPKKMLIAESNEYDIIGFMMKDKEIVTIQDSSYTIEIEVNETIHISTPRMNVLCKDADDNRYPLFKNHPTLRIESTNSKNNRNILRISHRGFTNQYRNIEEILSDPASRNDGANVILDLSRTDLPTETGIYTIRARNNKSFSYILMKDASFTFDKSIYTEEGTGVLTYGPDDETIEFNVSDGTVTTPIRNIDGRDISITVQVPSRRFSFDKRKWFLFGSRELYAKSMPCENIFIYTPVYEYPAIIVDFKGSKPQNLEIDGEYLRCDLHKINMIRAQMEQAKVMIPNLSFKCGNHDLFCIRYTADYSIFDRTITRSNIPEGTTTFLKTEDGQRIQFTGDSFTLDDSITGKVSVIESFDDGFDSSETLAFEADVGLTVDMDKDSIINGVIPEKIAITLNGQRIDVPKGLFDHLIIKEGPLDPDDLPFIESSYRELPVKNSIEVGLTIARRIQNIILTDDDPKRILKRIHRFDKAYPEFTLELCEKYLSIEDDTSVRYLAQYISKKQKSD